MVIESLMLQLWLGEVLGWWSAYYGREVVGEVRLVIIGLGLLGGLLWLLFADIVVVWREGVWIDEVSSKQKDGAGDVRGVVER
jgi:hypothetical protein